jgi:hypothetical protein
MYPQHPPTRAVAQTAQCFVQIVLPLGLQTVWGTSLGLSCSCGFAVLRSTYCHVSTDDVLLSMNTDSNMLIILPFFCCTQGHLHVSSHMVTIECHSPRSRVEMSMM